MQVHFWAQTSSHKEQARGCSLRPVTAAKAHDKDHGLVRMDEYGLGSSFFIITSDKS